MVTYPADIDSYYCRWRHVVVAPWPAGTIQTSKPQQNTPN